MKLSRPTVGFYSSICFDPVIAVQNGFKFLDTDDILRFAVRLVFTSFENFPPLEFDPTVFETNNSVTIGLLNREISIRRKKIADFLVASIDGEFDASCIISDSEVDAISANVDKLYALQKIVRETISPVLLSDDYALYGKNLPLDLPNSYIVASNNETPECLLARAVKKRDLFQAIRNKQGVSSISRNEFHWTTNSFLVPIRQIYKNEISKMVAGHGFIFGEFDLSIQLLMHLGAYAIDEVWNVPEDLIMRLLQFTEEEACADFKRMFDKNRVTPNDSLIREELSRLADDLDEYFSGLHVNIGDEYVRLPSIEMCSASSNPFTNINAHTELVLGSKEYIDGPNGKIMVVHEKLSSKKIIFSPILPEISSLYSRGFCNLHYANPGEIAVYGAFVEGDNLPFAYSSYGKISYNYTKEMLSYLGFADGEIIESSRAWNAAWAPENTMSVLFSYSQDRLKEKFGNGIRGVLTSINPNLGFSASAFRGIHFEIISLKPTIFSYQLMDGKPYFHSKNEIAKNLGIQISELPTSRYYTDNKIPFLPTIELLYLYDKDERRKLLKSPIYVVSKNDFLSNR